MKRFLFITALFTIVTVSLTHAQLTPDISLNSIPNDPQPLQKVTVTAESYGINLDQASITWKYNNVVIDSGVGRKTVTLTAPKAGTTGIITVSTTGAEGVTATLILRPGSVDLLWEATDSYTPPFYKGKALASVNSLIRIAAIASSVAPKQLTYTWSGNDSVLGSLSGYGKSSLVFRNDVLDPIENISVSAQGGAFTGGATISITPGTPSMVIYEKEEGFIDYANGSSTTLTTQKPGLILRIEPFFFSVATSLARSLVFSVQEGDVDITNTSAPNEIYLSSPGRTISSLFAITINTVTYSLQNLTRNFTINFL
ncbi:hypothetical protein K2Q02_00250 [Patescibacteria group bacterium]|nr:hypothetical protein [Patescibacteria group bacterium]